MNFKEICRIGKDNSGLASGDTYGGHPEEPPLEEDASPIAEWGPGGAPVLRTGVLLDTYLDVEDDMQELFIQTVGNPPDGIGMSEAMGYMQSIGCRVDPPGNTYNGDYLLDKAFQYMHCYKMNQFGFCEALTVISIHKGGDIRGGYTIPFICSGTIPSLNATILAVQGRDSQGDIPIDTLGMYIWNNYDELTKEVHRWFEHTRTKDTVCVELCAGEILKLKAGI